MSMLGQQEVRAPFRPWGGCPLQRVRGALCQDGVQRTAVCTADPDTFFSQPARVTVDGKTLSGFLSTERICTRCLRSDTDHDCHQPDGRLDFSRPRRPDGEAAEVQDEVWVFTAYRYAKNASLIVEELEQEQSD
jgi:hypothetical protein